jgi:putative photosynthetic complex assembly protein 2
MSNTGQAVLFAMFLWWFATGVVLYLDGLPRRTFRWSIAAASLLLLAALAGLRYGAARQTEFASCVGFASAIVAWGWVEMTFLMGFVTGSRRSACAHGCTGRAHFLHAVQAILHHELLILGVFALVAALCFGQPNPVGFWTFLALWVMRLSAKLNLFIGVRNTGAEFLPPHLLYLQSFFRVRRMNALFPVSILGGSIAAALAIAAANDVDAPSYRSIAWTLVATMLVLGVVEHVFLMLPLRTSALWSWGMRSRDRRAAAAAQRAALAD